MQTSCCVSKLLFFGIPLVVLASSPPPAAGVGFQPPPAAPGQGFGAPTPPGPPQAPGHSAMASPFYPQQPGTPGMPGPGMQPVPPVPGGAVAPQAHEPLNNENIDFSVKIPERLIRFTANKVAQTAQLAAGTKIPFGAVMRPMAPDGEDDEPIETVQPGNAGIIRCKRCRTYINAFVSWSEHGRRWRCNICSQINDCPAAYFCHLDDHGLRRDRYERPELSKAVVEFIAPAEYMVRPPQEPSYFFVIDVSATAVRSGMVHSTAKAIKESLDDLPGRGRTKVGFITFDNAVHYYNLSPELKEPQMMVVADLKELFVPLPDHLLVNLQESRECVDKFLDSLPEMFVKDPVVSQSCLGPALKAGFTVMKSIGGKLCVFQSIMPNLGDGALIQRENRSLMGTPNEIKLLRPEVTWYKDTAVEFSRQQISVDMFLFPYQYMDLAAMAELPKYTAGAVHSYVSFNHKKDGPRFEQTLNKILTQTTAFEAVMRVRCTKGMRISNFYGNFYIRGTDLLALPNCNTDSVFGFDLAHDEQNVASNYVALQAALLYTSSEGQRRIRVMTQVLPVSNRSSELMASVDTDAVCNLLSKQAVEVAVKTSLENARSRLQQTCLDMIRTSKEGDRRTVSGYAVPPPHGHLGGQESEEKTIPENLQLLPLYILALMKNVAFRGGTDVHPDERIQAHRHIVSMWTSQSKHFIYPRLFSIHDMDENVGYSVEDLPDGGGDDAHVAGRNRILLPPVVNLSVERLTSNGVYLLDNGIDMYLWVGRATDLSILGSLFGVQSLDDCDPLQVPNDCQL
jgi:protein transport protein SEC24